MEIYKYDKRKSICEVAWQNQAEVHIKSKLIWLSILCIYVDIWKINPRNAKTYSDWLPYSLHDLDISIPSFFITSGSKLHWGAFDDTILKKFWWIVNISRLTKIDKLKKWKKKSPNWVFCFCFFFFFFFNMVLCPVQLHVAIGHLTEFSQVCVWVRTWV